MMLAGFQQLVFNHSLGFAYDRPVRAVCWHTTEGFSVQGAVSVYQNIQACPHLTVDPETHERFQHVPLGSAAYALRNLQGGCETNSTGIIQIEVVGKAAETWAWSQARLQWLGEEVLAPILDAYPDIPHTVYPGGRMNCQQWNDWPGGICRHADVPENDHWDPGDLDLQRILDYATGDDNMTLPELVAAMGPLARLENGIIQINLAGYGWASFSEAMSWTHQEAQGNNASNGGVTAGQVAAEFGRRLSS